MRLIITCEHGGNQIPEKWSFLFPKPCQELETHLGFDIGALHLAKALAEKFSAPLFYNEITRLLIDFNRSAGHKNLFSGFSKKLSQEEKYQIIKNYYEPYRQSVFNLIRSLKPLIHFSIHSFTPILNGKVRDVDVGLLYDPKRALEKKLSAKIRKNLPNSLRVRMNRPYLGISDGFIPTLRQSFSSSEYIGIELEVNQKILTIRTEAEELEKNLIQSLEASLF